MEITKPSLPWGDKPAPDGAFRMIDVGAKPATARRAIAEGRIRMSAAAFRAVVEKANPKGDVLAMAEVAGIMAAKRTADLLPLCHPLPLEKIQVRCFPEPESLSVRVTCEASTTSKTGVEMEALCGVNGALLAIYDLSKAVDPVLTLTEIRLLLKEGGKSGRWEHPEKSLPGKSVTEKSEMSERDSESNSGSLRGIHATVITVSDRASAARLETGASEHDTSGPAIAERLSAQGAQVERQLVADVKADIVRAIEAAAKRSALVLLTGGTGLSPRDVTPEALEEACERLIPGIGELLRTDGARFTPMSWLSRSTAGLRGSTLVITLPGSRNAVIEGLGALLKLLPHALHTARGGDHAHRVP